MLVIMGLRLWNGMIYKMYSEPCPICGQSIPEIRVIVYECKEHGEFAQPEINRVKFKGKEKRKVAKLRATKVKTCVQATELF